MPPRRHRLNVLLQIKLPLILIHRPSFVLIDLEISSQGPSDALVKMRCILDLQTLNNNLFLLIMLLLYLFDFLDALIILVIELDHLLVDLVLCLLESC